MENVLQILVRAMLQDKIPQWGALTTAQYSFGMWPQGGRDSMCSNILYVLSEYVNICFVGGLFLWLNERKAATLLLKILDAWSCYFLEWLRNILWLFHQVDSVLMRKKTPLRWPGWRGQERLP